MHLTGRNRWRIMVRVIAFWVLFCCLPARIPCLAAQGMPEINHLVQRTAKEVAKTQAHVILIYRSLGCLGTPDICDAFNVALRSRLKTQIPGVQFISAEDAAKYLPEAGFLTVDAYLGALDDVADRAGADLSIGARPTRKGTRCDLHATVVDAKHHYALADLSTHIPCQPAGTNKGLALMKDPGSSAMLIVPGDGTQTTSSIHNPSCIRCPAPRYTGDARAKGIQGEVRVLLTVTPQGTVDNARVVGTVDYGLAHAAITAVEGWTFKPATGRDGKPFAARIQVIMTFRLISTPS